MSSYAIAVYYGMKFAEYGLDDVRALGWGNRQSQLIRFDVLKGIADLRGTTVLDFGCGFGDLYAYLGSEVNYIGYDNNPQMLAAARKKYPFAKFVDEPVEADYILESGAFNLVADWPDEVRRLWSLARRGMALNFLSSLAEKKTPGVVYADPFRTARFCSTLTNKFTLRHDYKSNDFCVYLYK